MNCVYVEQLDMYRCEFNCIECGEKMIVYTNRPIGVVNNFVCRDCMETLEEM